MKLLCVTSSVVYDIMEHSDYYSTLYYNRRVCQDDKYLLNIEENEHTIVVSSLLSTLLENFIEFRVVDGSSAIDELIDNAKNERIDNYFEYIKHDTEYLEKLEAKSIYLINELTK
uniref:Uncharacterized protein n=1 Tax=Meloidogyne javanica TaxID=6303 RepID=A0A915N013_MELJA